jgi:hypothetical protein
MNERLTKLIDDYGHAMYNLGECSGDYESRQTRITLKKLQNYINMWLIRDKVDEVHDIPDFDGPQPGSFLYNGDDIIGE